nr:MAG: hypothetical protein 1 [Leviviridae sp.]
MCFSAAEGGCLLGQRTRFIPFETPHSGSLLRHFIDQGNPANNYVVTTSSSNDDLDTYFRGSQVTDSEAHPAWLRRRQGSVFKGDLGGPFSTTKKTVEAPLGLSASISGERYSEPNSFNPEGRYIDRVIYSGPILPLAPWMCEWPVPSSSSSNTLDELGTTAIARCSPSNPTVDLAVTIGEFFKEGIPATIGGTLQQWKSLSGRDRRRAIGKEHLNIEFGWKPLINDLVKFSHAIVHADKILSDYQRGSGSMVRRRYEFPKQEESSILLARDATSPWINPSHGLLYTPLANQGKVYRTYKYERKQWFSGAFTYYVPPPDGLRNSMARAVIQARKLLGISLTPDTLWNLAPWSWAIDWFTNTGDVLSNWSDWAIDNQVLLYGYMMEHTVQSYTYTFTGPTGLYGGGVPGDISMVTETKLRRQATPYGFGLNWADFSARQLSIITALGISRSK